MSPNHNLAHAIDARELVYLARLESLTPAALLAEWEAIEEASMVEPEGYKPAYVHLLLRALREATARPVTGFGVRMLPAEKGPGGRLEGDFLYVLLPSGEITQAMWYETYTDNHEGYSWCHYTDIDCIDPLPVQPTYFFTPPTADAAR